MKPTKVSEASGAGLNWMVATALGRGPKKDMDAFGGVWRGWWLSQGGEYERMPDYCGAWAQGGPIIEREHISVTYHESYTTLPGMHWRAYIQSTAPVYGPTILIAAMRCFAASKLGEEVEVPDELV